MDYHVLRRLENVTRIRLTLKCKCPGVEFRITHCFIYKSVDAEILIVPAFRNINLDSADFDEDYFQTVVMNTGRPPRLLGAGTVPSLPNQSAFARATCDQVCLTCDIKKKLLFVQVPECTWMLIVEVPDKLKKMSLQCFLRVTEFRTSGVIFKLGWIQMIDNSDHLVSMHLFNGRWYFYDDLHDARVKRIDISTFEMESFEHIRAFYYRETEINPHRCLKRLDDEDIAA